MPKTKQFCLLMTINPLPDDKILDRSKLKQSADGNFKFDDNSRKFSKRVENTVGKGEIARYEQFLLFPQCFQKACFPGASKVSLFGDGLMTIKEKGSEYCTKNGRNSCNKNFPRLFSTHSKTNSTF